MTATADADEHAAARNCHPPPGVDTWAGTVKLSAHLNALRSIVEPPSTSDVSRRPFHIPRSGTVPVAAVSGLGNDTWPFRNLFHKGGMR